MIKKLVGFFLFVIFFCSINIFEYKVYAADFLNKGTGGLSQIDESTLRSTSDFIYNLLLAIAMVVAVIIGIVIGIQFMTASIEEKAKVKESLMPYVVGCVVVFGAFGIWKLAVTILSNW